MLIVKIDHLDAESLQALVAAFAHIVRPAVHAQEGAIGCAHVAELGGDDEFFPLALDGAADELLVGSHAIHVSGVEEGDAEVQRAVDGRE